MGVIDVDPASNVVAQETVKAATFYTREQNGMAHPWPGRVWLNPPYSQPDIRLFIDKLVDEYESGRRTEAILLTNNSSDTEWFPRAVLDASAVCFTRGRIKFVSPASASQSPTQGHPFFYFGDNAARFADVFAGVGCTLARMGAAAPAERIAA
jgi:ParB family chromosome partitioning protein